MLLQLKTITGNTLRNAILLELFISKLNVPMCHIKRFSIIQVEMILSLFINVILKITKDNKTAQSIEGMLSVFFLSLLHINLYIISIIQIISI